MVNFWEIMQGMVPQGEPQENIYPWEEDYENAVLADYINLTGQSYYNITPEDMEYGYHTISEEMDWIEGTSGTYWGWCGSPPNNYQCEIPYWTEGGFSPTGEGRSVNFDIWKETYAEHFPTFQMQDYDRLVDQYLFDKETLISDLTQDARNVKFDPRSVVQNSNDRAILENTINVSSQLKDLSHMDDVNSLMTAYENDLYSSIGDLAETGAFEFLTNPEELDWIQGDVTWDCDCSCYGYTGPNSGASALLGNCVDPDGVTMGPCCE